MKAINYIRLISLCIFVVPIVVINLCLFVSINYEIFENTIFTVDQIGRSGFSIPYIDGSLSISRAARTYPQYLLFKPGMIITAVLLILYWIKNNELFKNYKALLEDTLSKIKNTKGFDSLPVIETKDIKFKKGELINEEILIKKIDYYFTNAIA